MLEEAVQQLKQSEQVDEDNLYEQTSDDDDSTPKPVEPTTVRSKSHDANSPQQVKTVTENVSEPTNPDSQQKVEPTTANQSSLPPSPPTLRSLRSLPPALLPLLSLTAGALETASLLCEPLLSRPLLWAKWLLARVFAWSVARPATAMR